MFGPASEFFGGLTGRGVIDVKFFTQSAIWIKPAGAKLILVQMIAGGSGGQAGNTFASGVAAVSGNSGSGGGFGQMYFPAAGLGATEPVTVGVGGAGGLPQTAPSTQGNPGANGGNSSFGIWMAVRGGVAGANGFGMAGGGGFLGSVATQAVMVNGVSGNTNAGTVITPAPIAGAAGGAASSVSAGGVVSAAAAGGTVGSAALGAAGATLSSLNTALAGGLPGTAANRNGQPGNSLSTFMAIGGSGGGGGFGNTTGNGGNGGAGGFPGAGGGAGGPVLNGFASGAGGAGGNGIVIIFSFF